MPYKNRALWAIKRRERLQTAKQQVYTHLGGKCRRCGFTDQRAFQIDHIYGNGSQHRKRNKDSLSRYKEVLKEEPNTNFQLLCANCNWIKVSENKENNKRLKHL